MCWPAARAPVHPGCRRAPGWLQAGLASVVLLVGGLSAATAERPENPDRICGEILAHERLKQRPADRTPQEHRELLLHLGLNPENLDTEDVAVYVKRPLSIEEVDDLRGAGVRINRAMYVPPVAGRHPHGFYLANIDYASLDVLRADDRIVRVVSTEFDDEPQNDLGTAMVNIPAVHSGAAAGPYLGEGVRIAVADSGVDLTHPDLPTPVETYDVTTGSDASEWSTDVTNTAHWHGTHVAGTAVGSGLLSNGLYVGGAPGAEFFFYKIGNDFNANASATSTIQSIARAVEVGADIYTRSYGGYDTYMDGSSAVCQAMDAAFEEGMLCFNSAGNSGGSGRHYSVTVAPGEVTEPFTLTLFNVFDAPYTSAINLRVIWLDDAPAHVHGVDLEALDLQPDEDFEQVFVGTSPRGTKAKRYILWPDVPPATQRTYTFTLANSTAGGAAPLVHLYQTSTGLATFDEPDPFYTVGHPAHADTVIAVGAWVHRAWWTDFEGEQWTWGFEADALAPFSSRGPRIDGAPKPEIVAPGSMTVSLRDGLFANTSWAIISNDGVNDGEEPADYYVAQGTSMSAPLAAGGAALVRQAQPSLTAEQMRTRLMATASSAAQPDDLVGHGMIDITAAITGPAADLNGDGAVDVEDLLVLLANWGECPPLPAPCIGDLTGDGEVGHEDLVRLLDQWEF